MRKGYKLKVLIKKFNFNELVTECVKQDWKIPLAHELNNTDIPYEEIWVATLPARVIDRVTHAYIFRFKSGNLLVSNRNNLQNAVVLVKEKE